MFEESLPKCYQEYLEACRSGDQVEIERTLKTCQIYDQARVNADTLERVWKSIAGEAEDNIEIRRYDGEFPTR